MKTALARRMIDAALTQAKQMEKHVSIVVVDAAGIPVLIDRNGEPAPFTTVIADGKAAAAAFTGRDSRDLATLAERNPALVGALTTRLGGRFAAIAGGLVLRQDGEVIGAIAASGAAADEDEAIAKAGAELIS